MNNNQPFLTPRPARAIQPRWRVAVGAIGVLAFSLSIASPVQASNFGKYYADNSDHYWARVNLTADGTTAANWGVTELNSRTDIDTFNDGTCKHYTDICFYDGNYEHTLDQVRGMVGRTLRPGVLQPGIRRIRPRQPVRTPVCPLRHRRHEWIRHDCPAGVGLS